MVYSFNFVKVTTISIDVSFVTIGIIDVIDASDSINGLDVIEVGCVLDF
jgi:hypothetical protein